MKPKTKSKVDAAIKRGKVVMKTKPKKKLPMPKKAKKKPKKIKGKY